MGRGYSFEASVADFYKEVLGEGSYRVASSGRTKKQTHTGVPGEIFICDVVGKSNFLPQPLLTECKHYKSEDRKTPVRSVRILKEWLDQTRRDAERNDCLCVFAFRIKGCRKTDKSVVGFDDANADWFSIPKSHLQKLFAHMRNLYQKQPLKQVSTIVLVEELLRRVKA